ncbi:MAG: flagellar protein FlaG [Treponema sp.]|jgi:flagellar protein FlaG|nr:flagellar protein FlaG [Treponema sp.]
MSLAIAPLGGGLSIGAPQEALQDGIHQARAAAFQQFAAIIPGAKPPAEKKHQEINIAAENIEKVSLAFNKKLKFVVDYQSHEVTVKVIDGETDKVIKVLPPEELQRLHSRIRETIGFLFDEMA